ncbi:GNAT family N-acetyltransferase [Colwellia sp.]|uniref:GNAT family N-acetyltransferase n=1 Tax=Colwellia sp. TaxID=56799 RepID=UPI0025BBD0FD|nr:GNAT family N-acetyltransferase [Colwellia sp.]
MHFETDRLVMSKISNDDAENLVTVLSDPDVMKYSTVGVHTEKQILAYIANCQQQYLANGYGHWAVYRKEDNAFVGVCGLNNHQVDNEDVFHINYRLASEHQGKGYAVESTLGVLAFAKKTLKLKSVHALIESDNVSSVKVVNRTGFTFAKATVFRGFNVDVYQVTL